MNFIFIKILFEILQRKLSYSHFNLSLFLLLLLLFEFYTLLLFSDWFAFNKLLLLRRNFLYLLRLYRLSIFISYLRRHIICLITLIFYSATYITLFLQILIHFKPSQLIILLLFWYRSINSSMFRCLISWFSNSRSIFCHPITFRMIWLLPYGNLICTYFL